MRSKAGYRVILWIAGISLLLSAACTKTRVLSTGGTLKFSVDTLKFDTVFTAAGSFTTGLLIYNPQNEEVIISSIRLQNGTTSYFHLNVDGFSGNNVPNLKIAAHDSLYVFATVNINPSDTLTPFIVTDELIATLNGKDFSIPFTAYGQNAHYIVSDSFSVANGPVTNWVTDKPYVVINSMEVGPGATLNIPANCRVYMHQNARIFVYGNLNVNGTASDSVVFQGDRLDRAYFGYIGYPGEGGGIEGFPGGTGNISHAVIKNCGGATGYYNYAIQPAALEVDTEGKLTIDHTIIENSIGYGILAWSGKLSANTCLVQGTGAQALAVIQGGTDSLINCTFANYGSSVLAHGDAGTLVVLNYFNEGNNNWIPGNLNGFMENCIVYGSLDSEIICDSLGGATASFIMKNCLLSMGNTRESFLHFDHTIFNQDPMFKSNINADFHLTTGSPAIGTGAGTLPGNDLDNKPWTNPIDIGCYTSP